MSRPPKRELDIAFGQLILTLRANIGLTQASLASILGVSRNAIGGWETGQTYPKAAYLRHLIALGLQERAFAAGQESDQIRALWRAAHQKVLLDEAWLHGLLAQQAPAPPPREANTAEAPPPRAVPQLDWGDAPDVPVFYGRAEEMARLTGWVVAERCRVVSVLGLGGIGKSAFTVTLMRQVAAAFEVVIWRSLRDAPACDMLLDSCLQVLAPQSLHGVAESLNERLDLLIGQLRERRVLLVLDNLEVLLEDRSGTGRMRAGFAGYARLLQRVGQTAHQSCLLLTSRENPADLLPLEGSRALVRAMRLEGLDLEAGAQLLSETDVAGSDDNRAQLIERYQGNPLALKLVARTITELFAGDIDPFLAQGELIFGNMRELLGEQFSRLSTLEQHIFFGLAIMREPASPDELLEIFSVPTSPAQVLEALSGLIRRSLAERGPRPGSVTLQSVVLEYATARLIAELGDEIARGQLDRLHSFALCHAQAKEYVRRSQEQLLLAPLLGQLRLTYPGQAALEAHIFGLLDKLRGQAHADQGYAAANLVALLGLLRENLRGLDLSRLALRGLPLQGVELQDANLSGALVQDCLFTEGFGAIRMVAISRDGQRWAAGSRRGEVWVWGDAGRALRLVWQAHLIDMVALVISPDGDRLASADFGGSVKLWDVERGTLLWTSEQTASINTLAFSADARVVASGGGDGKIHIWDAQSGAAARVPIELRGGIAALAWSPDGRLLACGCMDISSCGLRSSLRQGPRRSSGTPRGCPAWPSRPMAHGWLVPASTAR